MLSYLLEACIEGRIYVAGARTIRLNDVYIRPWQPTQNCSTVRSHQRTLNGREFHRHDPETENVAVTDTS